MARTPNAVAAYAAALLTFVSGCASNEERPTEELIRARTLIEQARQSGAHQYAARDVEGAQDKLRSAEIAADQRDNAVARRLAVQASLDAELAVAKARSGQAETAAEEVQASLATLREEAARARVRP
jgi:hypothetical protein